MEHPLIVLASSSPYRRALLARLRLPFEARAPAIDEQSLPGEAARETATRLAEAKARAMQREYPQALIIGCDQVAAVNGATLGKPGDHANAVAQLKAMRGRSVAFHTAVALLNGRTGKAQVADVPTIVHFRHYSDHEIERYLELEQPYDCAGAAKIEGLGIILVERVSGDDPTALIGLPLMRLTAMLLAEGIAIV